MTTLVFGGMFDPPHIGHVGSSRARSGTSARSAPSCSSRPIRGIARSSRARPTGSAWRALAFPGDDVELDEHPRTIDMLRAGPIEDPTLILGADELADFPNWKEPERCSSSLASRSASGQVYAVSDAPTGVTIFEIEPTPVSSTDIRRLGRRRRVHRRPRAPAGGRRDRAARSVPGLDSERSTPETEPH